MGLFKGFSKVTHQEWLEKIKTDLKGKDFNDTLVWKSPEGIDVQPFYNAESLSSNIFPSVATPNGWKIRESIIITTIKEANQKALIALKGGANSILFIGDVKTASEMTLLLKDMMVELIDIHFYSQHPKQVLELFQHEVDRNTINGSVSYDYLGELFRTGNWADSKEADFKILYELTSSSPLKSIAVNGQYYNAEGATIVQELAFSLSQAVEYLSVLTDKGISADDIAKKTVFNFGIGSNYFFEIAKLRAVRTLWQIIVEQYQVSNNTPMYLHCSTSTSNLTSKDPHSNILRGTTEAMSAIIGGCDSLSVTPYNFSFEDTNEFSDRIARNVQIVLKEEAFLDKVTDASSGSYYIETLTDQIAKKTWDLFKEIEAKGGFLACLENNFIQDAIKANTNQKEEKLAVKK